MAQAELAPAPGSPSDAEEFMAQVQEWAAEVARHRLKTSEAVPGPDAGPPAVYEALLEVRGYLDRVETLLSIAMSVRAASDITAREAEQKAGDDRDRAIVQRAQRAREYQAASERLAAANLDVLGVTIRARAQRKLADLAASAEAQIRLAYRGMEATRNDLAAALRHVGWVSSLDR